MRNMLTQLSSILTHPPEGFFQGPWKFRRGPKVWNRSRTEAGGPSQSAHGGENR